MSEKKATLSPREEAYRRLRLLVMAKERGIAARWNAEHEEKEPRGPWQVRENYALEEVALDMLGLLVNQDLPFSEDWEDPDGKCSDLMTPYHPQWRRFCELLEGPEGINARKGKDGKWRWDCTAKPTYEHARDILKKLRFSKARIERSLAYFGDNGGYCDCEILFNVDAAMKRTGAERLQADLARRNAFMPSRTRRPRGKPKKRSEKKRRPAKKRRRASTAASGGPV